MLALDELEAEWRYDRGDVDGAVAWLEALIDRGRQVERLRRRQVAMLADAGRGAEARARLDRLLDGRDTHDIDDAGLLHVQALAAMAAGHADAMTVDLPLNRALRLVPDDVSLAITRGIADIRRHRDVDGGNRIARAFRRATSAYDRSRALGYLAIAAARCRQPRAAERFLAAFEHVNRSEPLRRQVRALLPGGPGLTSDRSPDRP